MSQHIYLIMSVHKFLMSFTVNTSVTSHVLSTFYSWASQDSWHWSQRPLCLVSKPPFSLMTSQGVFGIPGTVSYNIPYVSCHHRTCQGFYVLLIGSIKYPDSRYVLQFTILKIFFIVPAYKFPNCVHSDSVSVIKYGST